MRILLFDALITEVNWIVMIDRIYAGQNQKIAIIASSVISSRTNYERTVYISIMGSTFSQMLVTCMHINVCLVRRAYPGLTWWTLPETKVEKVVTASGTVCRISIRREMDGPIHGTLITIKSHIPVEIVLYDGLIYRKYNCVFKFVRLFYESTFVRRSIRLINGRVTLTAKCE